MSKKLFSLAVVCAVFAAGCGSKSEDIAKVMKATQGSATVVARQAAAQVRQMQAVANQHVANYQNQLIFADRSVRTIDSCGGSVSVDSGVCTASCNSAMTSLTANCTFAGQSMSCGGVAYTFKDGTLALTMIIAGSIFTIDMTMAANVAGGDLDGKIDCKLGMTIDAANPPTDESLNCSNFSCTYDGSAIDCEDLKEDFGGSC